MNHSRWAILIVFVCSHCCFNIGISQYEDKILDVIHEAQSESAQFGISVRSETGEVIYAHQSQTRLMPASTLKLITTLTMLDQYDSSYAYRTRVGYTGHILGDGTLTGDLVIVGSGDPSLGAPEDHAAMTFSGFLQRVVNIVNSAGIKRIEGGVMIDDSIYDKEWVHPSWSWDDLTNYYSSGASGFNIHHNYYHIDLMRFAKIGSPTRVKTLRPMVPDLTIANHVTTGKKGSGDQAYIYGDPYGYDRSIRGTIPSGTGIFTIKGALPNPRLFAIFHLREALMKASIKVDHEHGDMNQSYQLKDVTELAVIRSQPLSALVQYANYTSNNLYCEAFFKSLGSQRSGQGSYASGRAAVMQYLNDEGYDESGITIVDGSGLSYRNRVSPDFMTSFMVSQGNKMGVDVLKKYIPRAGQQGSVRNFLSGYESQKHSWLKSGSMSHVVAYAGVIDASSAETIFVSIIVNGHSSNSTLRHQIEKIIDIIYKEL